MYCPLPYRSNTGHYNSSVTASLSVILRTHWPITQARFYFRAKRRSADGIPFQVSVEKLFSNTTNGCEGNLNHCRHYWEKYFLATVNLFISYQPTIELLKLELLRNDNQTRFRESAMRIPRWLGSQEWTSVDVTLADWVYQPSKVSR